MGAPSSDADSVCLLGAHGVVDEDLAARLAAAVGFRDVLVREDAEVDDDQGVADLDDVGDLERFVVATARWGVGPGGRLKGAADCGATSSSRRTCGPRSTGDLYRRGAGSPPPGPPHPAGRTDRIRPTAKCRSSSRR